MTAYILSPRVAHVVELSRERPFRMDMATADYSVGPWWLAKCGLPKPLPAKDAKVYTATQESQPRLPWCRQCLR